MEAVLVSHKKHRVTDGQSPLVYAPRFPHTKRERWTVLLIETGKKRPPRAVSMWKVCVFRVCVCG